jgi:hypothetical protein
LGINEQPKARNEPRIEARPFEPYCEASGACQQRERSEPLKSTRRRTQRAIRRGCSWRRYHVAVTSEKRGRHDASKRPSRNRQARIGPYDVEQARPTVDTPQQKTSVGICSKEVGEGQSPFP